MNPAVRDWERTVQRIREEFIPVVADAQRVHEQMLEDLRAVHSEQLRGWNAREDERKHLQVQHESDLQAWDMECRERRAQQDAWTSDPRQSLIARSKRLRTGVVAGAVLVAIVALGIALQ